MLSHDSQCLTPWVHKPAVPLNVYMTLVSLLGVFLSFLTYKMEIIIIVQLLLDLKEFMLLQSVFSAHVPIPICITKEETDTER